MSTTDTVYRLAEIETGEVYFEASTFNGALVDFGGTVPGGFRVVESKAANIDGYRDEIMSQSRKSGADVLELLTSAQSIAAKAGSESMLSVITRVKNEVLEERKASAEVLAAFAL